MREEDLIAEDVSMNDDWNCGDVEGAADEDDAGDESKDENKDKDEETLVAVDGVVAERVEPGDKDVVVKEEVAGIEVKVVEVVVREAEGVLMENS